MDAYEVAEKVMEKIEEGKDKILTIKMYGKLGKGVKSEINRNKIMEHAKLKGYLYSKIYISDLENPNAPEINTQRRTASEVEVEYLEKQKYSNTEIKVAKQLINILGKKIKPSEIKGKVTAAKEIIRGFLLDNKKDVA